MKRILLILLVGLLAISIVACNNSKDENVKKEHVEKEEDAMFAVFFESETTEQRKQ